MRTNTKKILGGVAVAGLVAVTGSAFTAGGLSRASGVASSDALGGTVTQTVTGAEISSIVYTRNADGSASGMEVTFTAALASGQTVTANGTGCTADAVSAEADYNCTVVDASNDIVVSDVLN